MHTHTYLAECPATLSDANLLSRTPICSLGRQFALSDANSLCWLPIRSFTRDVTRPERSPMPWLGSGWESQEFAGVLILIGSRALSLFSFRVCIYIYIYTYIYIYIHIYTYVHHTSSRSSALSLLQLPSRLFKRLRHAGYDVDTHGGI
jgi:hypothetical protein